MKQKSKLEKIADFAQKHMTEAAINRQKKEGEEMNPNYRMEHTLRVSNYGKILAEAEGADVELVVAACLLHDIAVFEPGERKNHGRLGAEISRPVLVDLGYTPEQVENICYSIAAHVDVEQPRTLEAKIVTDADNIDRFGAYRAYLWILENMTDYQTLVIKLNERLHTLNEYRSKDMMQTPTGNTLFNEQLDFQVEFFERIVKESDWTVLPRV